MSFKYIWLNKYERAIEVYSPHDNKYIYFIDIFQICLNLEKLRCEDSLSVGSGIYLKECKLQDEINIPYNVAIEVLYDELHNIAQAISLKFQLDHSVDEGIIAEIKNKISVLLKELC